MLQLMVAHALSGIPLSRRISGSIFACAALLLSAAAASADVTQPGLTAQPLAAKTAARGATMFHELSPQETGIVTTNDYADPRMWTDLYREFDVGEVGTGVAIGDYDNDGKPDLFVVSKTESCRLFRNLGGFKFEDVTEKAGVLDRGPAATIWKQGVTFADVNNDGFLDIYVCRFNAPNLLYVNQGNGEFKEMAHAYGLDVKDASVMASFCDYDRDGWLDVFIQTNLLNFNEHPQGQKNYLFHNNRDGTFTNVTQRAGITGEAQGHSATWWDFNNDGWPDLYVANDFAAADKLYRNNHDGTFTNVLNDVVPHTPFSSMGSDFGDINNDGLIDFLVCDMAATTHEKDQRGMADSRARTVEDDKHPEVAPQYERNALYLNTNAGACLEAAYLTGLAATDWTWSPRFEDLDNDGRLDLFVTNGAHREATNIDLLARQTMAETPQERLRIMRDSPVLAEAHFGLRNAGDLHFENVSAAWGLDQRGVSFGAALGDLDGDGDLDLVYSNYKKGVTVLRNDSDTGHRLLIELRGTRSNRFGVGASVRIETTSGVQVRQLGLARGLLSSSEPLLHFGLGDDKIVKRLSVAWPSGASSVYENLAVDQRLTITEPTNGAALVTTKSPETSAGKYAEVSAEVGLSFTAREEAVDETALQRLLPLRLNRRGPAVAVGDLNGDSVDDVVLGGTTLDPARVLLGSRDGKFSPARETTGFVAGATDDGPILIFDANGDGHADVLITKGGGAAAPGSADYQPNLLLGDGRGHFELAAKEALPSLPISAGAAVAADFDHDGNLDVFIGARVSPGQYPITPRSALISQREGRWMDVTDSVAPGLREVGMVTAAMWSDVDDDGWVDLLVTVEWGELKYFHNVQGKSFEDWTSRAGFAAAGTGWWTSLAAGDFNGDGRTDYVAGNVGLNTQFRADAEHPALMFFGDFKGTGEEPQIVEAYFEGDRVYPWRTRSSLGAAVPSVLKRFLKNNAYARATLEEVLGKTSLAAAQRFAATELRSGVFLSQPNGTYRFQALPRIAQIAPIVGIVVGDFDRDGHDDLYCIQNSFSPVPVIGRFDGGLSQLLRGGGKGNFVAVPAQETMLVVRGDAKALALVDSRSDGSTDFLVTRNNAPTLVYRATSSAGAGHSLAVRLLGTKTNPAAVGAKIVVTFADGSSHSEEICAGSGNYSQSTATCFFGFPPNNPPKSVGVHWPTGAETKHDLPPNLSSVVLSSPSP